MLQYTLLAPLALFISLAVTAPVAIISRGPGETHIGDTTYYNTGLGACGNTSTDADFIVSIAVPLFESFGDPNDANPNNNPVCGRQITATAPEGGQSVTVTVVDKCEGCEYWDLDMAPAAFNVLADPSVGRIHGVTWVMLPAAP